MSAKSEPQQQQQQRPRTLERKKVANARAGVCFGDNA